MPDAAPVLSGSDSAPPAQSRSTKSWYARSAEMSEQWNRVAVPAGGPAVEGESACVWASGPGTRILDSLDGDLTPAADSVDKEVKALTG